MELWTYTNPRYPGEKRQLPLMELVKQTYKGSYVYPFREYKRLNVRVIEKLHEKDCRYHIAVGTGNKEFYFVTNKLSTLLRYEGMRSPNLAAALLASKCYKYAPEAVYYDMVYLGGTDKKGLVSVWVGGNTIEEEMRGRNCSRNEVCAYLANEPSFRKSYQEMQCYDAWFCNPYRTEEKFRIDPISRVAIPLNSRKGLLTTSIIRNKPKKVGYKIQPIEEITAEQLRHILFSNPLGKRIFLNSSLEDYVSVIEEMEARFSEQSIRNLVDKIPAELVGVRRKNEIKKVLIARMRLLKDGFRKYHEELKSV